MYMWLWSHVREGTHQPVIGWQPHRNSWFLTRVCVLECVCVCVCTHTFVCIYVCMCNYCFCSVTKSGLTICEHINCSTPGFHVLHCLPEFAQTQVHWVSDAIQLSYRLLPPFPSFCLSQHQGLFQWISSSHQVAKSIRASPSVPILPINIQGWFPLGFTGLISLQSKELSRVFSTSVWKCQFLQCSAFFMVQLPHPYMSTGETIALTIQIFVSNLSAF